MVSAFVTSDKRKAISVVNISGTDCINKYPSGQTGRDPVIVSRIAEMYLISAEAQGRINGIGRLNELRQTRGLSAVSVSSDEDYLTAILSERRLEFLGENLRYYDLVRTGKAISTLNILNYQTVLPIPGRELQNNTNLTPNPGY
ncbi:SusD family protein [compost metagenome]